jgi:hypothetical protein
MGTLSTENRCMLKSIAINGDFLIAEGFVKHTFCRILLRVKEHFFQERERSVRIFQS